jgi:hypothetical protein
MEGHRSAFNQADSANGNHGDHMVEIFDIAARAAVEKQEIGLAEAMVYAAGQLRQRGQNGSAQVYASGLEQLAAQLGAHQATLDDLTRFVQGLASEEIEKKTREETTGSPPSKSSLLKALLAGLRNWQRVESGQPPVQSPLDMGYLFDLGVAYMQAKQHGVNRLETLAEAAASVSPLSRVPYRAQSGKMAIQSLLEALASAPVKG